MLSVLRDWLSEELAGSGVFVCVCVEEGGREKCKQAGDTKGLQVRKRKDTSV